MKKSLNTSPSGNARVINLRYIPLTSDKYQRDQPWVTGDAPSLYPPPPRLLFMHSLGSFKYIIMYVFLFFGN